MHGSAIVDWVGSNRVSTIWLWCYWSTWIMHGSAIVDWVGSKRVVTTRLWSYLRCTIGLH